MDMDFSFVRGPIKKVLDKAFSALNHFGIPAVAMVVWGNRDGKLNAESYASKCNDTKETPDVIMLMAMMSQHPKFTEFVRGHFRDLIMSHGGDMGAALSSLGIEKPINLEPEVGREWKAKSHAEDDQKVEYDAERLAPFQKFLESLNDKK